MRPISLESRHQPRACGNGSPPCPRAPAEGHNPLGLCDEHRAAYADRLLSQAHDAPCSRCAATPGVPYVHIIGSMCFGCGLSAGGTVCSAWHREEATGNIRRELARFVRLAREGRLDLAGTVPGIKHPAGVYLAALLVRAPDRMGVQAMIALRAVLSPLAIEKIEPAHLRATHGIDD